MPFTPRGNERTNSNIPGDLTTGDMQAYRHGGDGIASPITAARIQGYYPAGLDYRDVQIDANGVLVSAGGGGGPATIADGADVAEGITTDAAVVAGAAGTVSAKLRRISADIGSILATGHPVTGTVDVSDRAARLLGVVDKGKVWDGTNIQTVKAGVIAVVGDNPAVVTLHPSSAATAVQPVSLAANTPDVTDRAARLLGRVRLTDDTNLSAIKAASVVALATDPALVVQLSPQDAKASVLHVTGTAAVNVALTITLPAAAAGLFHYITSIQWVKLYAVVGIASGAGNIITSTNLPGSPAWTTEQLALAAGAVVTVIDYKPTTPLKSSVAATATTIVAPLQLQTIWRGNVSYYTAP